MGRFSHRLRSLLYRAAVLVILLLCGNSFGTAQSPSISNAEVEKRVEATLSKMNRDEKLTIIGGINDFYIQAIPPGLVCRFWACRMVRWAWTTMDLRPRIPQAFCWRPLGTRNSRDAQA